MAACDAHIPDPKRDLDKPFLMAVEGMLGERSKRASMSFPRVNAINLSGSEGYLGERLYILMCGGHISCYLIS